MDKTTSEADIGQLFGSLLPSFSADTAAILIQPQRSHQPTETTISWQAGPRSLWNDYLALSQPNQCVLLRMLRQCTYPVALSDIAHHLRLFDRLSMLNALLARQGYNEALVVPLFDQQSHHSAMVISGRNLRLVPARRHWIIRSAIDVAARVTFVRNPSSKRPLQQPHLTSRQLQVASWLIEGKSDWEIGQILKISPKTVNFHVENMKRAYDVKTRNQFVAAFVHRNGYQPGSAEPTRQPGSIHPAPEQTKEYLRDIAVFQTARYE